MYSTYAPKVLLIVARVNALDFLRSRSVHLATTECAVTRWPTNTTTLDPFPSPPLPPPPPYPAPSRTRWFYSLALPQGGDGCLAHTRTVLGGPQSGRSPSQAGGSAGAGVPQAGAGEHGRRLFRGGEKVFPRFP